MARIFAYIVHKGWRGRRFRRRTCCRGAKDRSAASPTAVVTAGARNSMRFAKRCAPRTARSGKSPTKLSPIPTLNWFGKALVKVLPRGQHRVGSARRISESIWRRGFRSS